MRRIRFDGPTDFLEVEGQEIPRGGEGEVSDETADLLHAWEEVDVTPVGASEARGGRSREGREDKEGE